MSEEPIELVEEKMPIIPSPIEEEVEAMDLKGAVAVITTYFRWLSENTSKIITSDPRVVYGLSELSLAAECPGLPVDHMNLCAVKFIIGGSVPANETYSEYWKVRAAMKIIEREFPPLASSPSPTSD